jgi:hypothetical protein
MVKDGSDEVNGLCLKAQGAHHRMALTHGGVGAAVEEINDDRA